MPVAMHIHTEIARQFLDELFGTPPVDSNIEIRRRTQSGVRQSFHSSVTEIDGERWEFDDVWYGLCLRQAGASSGREENLTYAVAVWVDIDVYKHNETSDAAIRRLEKFENPPTFVIHSGGGLQAIWKLNRLVDVRQPAQALYVREVCRGLALKLGGDLSVHDLPRVLRLPGTRNQKYAPPRDVVVVKHDTRLIYGVEDLAKYRAPVGENAKRVNLPAQAESGLETILRLSDKMKALIERGWEPGCGYTSRSELDQAAVVALLSERHTDEEIIAVWRNPKYGIGAKYREKGTDGDRYLATTLASGKKWVLRHLGGVSALSTSPMDTVRLKLEDGVIKAHRPDRNEWRTVYTKTLVPLARLRGATNAWHVRVADEFSVTLDSVALASSNSLKRVLPPVGAWTGNDADAQALIPYFESFAVPVRMSVDVIGWHGDYVVFPNAILGLSGIEPEAPLVYVGSSGGATLRMADDWPALAKAVGGLLLELHEPGTIHAVAGWFLATFAAPQIRALASRAFPILNVWGSTGSGKTTLLRLLARLAGATREPISIQGSTDFTRLVNLASTNTLPIVFDEHRAGNRLTRFYSTLREAFQEEEHERGRSDLTVVRRALTAPIAVAGESALPDPALRQRALITKLSPGPLGDLDPPSPVRHAKNMLEALPLVDFAGGAYQHVRSKDIAALWRDELSRVTRLASTGTDERKRLGLVTSLVGLRLYDEFLPRANDEMLQTMSSALNGEEEPSVIESFVTTLFVLLQRRELRADQDLKLEGNSLFLNPSLALPKVSTYLEHTSPALPASKDAIREHLRVEYEQRIGQGLVRSMRTGKRLNGVSEKAIELSVDAIESSSGITRQQWEAALSATRPSVPFAA